jgi:hypothetical protein
MFPWCETEQVPRRRPRLASNLFSHLRMSDDCCLACRFGPAGRGGA